MPTVAEIELGESDDDVDGRDGESVMEVGPTGHTRVGSARDECTSRGWGANAWQGCTCG